MAAATSPLRETPIALRSASRELLLDGKPVDVSARALDLLIALSERRDRVVSKNELLDLVWPNLVVEENNIEVHISALRRVLGRSAIATIPGRGYRLTAPLVDHAGTEPERPEQRPEPVVGAAPTLRTNLPDRLPALIGRADELSALAALVDEQPLVTLLGAGGAGKTRLAQAILDARREHYAQGICWVELAAVNDASALPSAIASALGVQLGSGNAADALVNALRPLELLMALDNAEHIVQDIAALVVQLRARAPGVRIVVTSQAPLRIEGEHVYRVAGLHAPAPDGPIAARHALTFGAVELFVARARAADRRFVLDDANAGQVVAICNALDGMPLAIELAAARLPMLGLAGLLARLDERLRLLGGGQRTAPKRLQTLAAALEFSHGLLAPREQIVFRRVAVFAGSASLDAIRHVVADPEPGGLDEWELVDALAELVDRSLVNVVEGDDGVNLEPRYRLLDTPLSFAREKLVATGELEALRARHATYMRRYLDAADDARLAGMLRQDEMRQRLRPDFDNARAALAWAVEHDHEAALALAAAMSAAMDVQMYRDAVGVWSLAEPILDSPTFANIPAIVGGRAAERCAVHWMNTRTPHALDRARQAVELLRDASVPKALYVARCAVAIAAARTGHRAEAEEALRSLRALEDPAWPVTVRVTGAQAAFHAENIGRDYGEAKRLSAAWLQLARQAGSNKGAAENNALDAAVGAGHFDEAFREGNALLRELSQTRRMNDIAFVSVNVAAAALFMGNPADARAVAHEGWRLAPMFDLQGPWADYFALMAALEGRTKTACLLLGYSDSRYDAMTLTRTGNEALAAERALALVAAKLPPDIVATLRREGRDLDDATVTTLAFAAML